MINYIQQIIAFALFEFWLLSFPLGISNDVEWHILFFLVPHTITYLLLGKLSINPTKSLLNASIIIIMLFTFIYPYSLHMQKLILIFTGILSTFLLLKIFSNLKTIPNMPLFVCIGLALGNTLVLLFKQIPIIDEPFIYLFYGISLISILPLPIQPIKDEPLLKELKNWLSFIFIFYLIGGIFYNFLLPQYLKTIKSEGLELIFYITAVFGAFLIQIKQKELLPILGIFLGIISFSIFQTENPLLIKYSLYLSQFSFGLFDFYLITSLLNMSDSIKVYSYGLGTMCLGITSGIILVGLMNNSTLFPMVVVGNVILAVSILVFYFISKKV
ncbi:MAG: hypothetical protein N3A59_08485 [Thermodesulfovibrionales bacterium]|nr:hypothetical protein [Thermodesulfovibrionales bacterium]